MAGRVGMVSLGCPKALVDSEQILARLQAEGYQLVSSYQEADAVIVNTCGFITPAVEESLQAIGEALDQNGKVIVTGCLGERPETILSRYPQVCSVTGSQDFAGVVEAVHRLLPPERSPHRRLLPSAPLTLTPRHYSYLKIAEGCNHTCSFCIIPKLRGLQVSRDAAELLGQAYRLVASGSRELLLIAQDSSAYGADLRHRPSQFQGRSVPADLVSLVDELSALGVWIRLHYVYPYPHVDRLVERMAEGKLLPYLDVPWQHASPKLLRAMRRPGSGRQLETIRRWRQIFPEVTIRSTFIVGFPGETEEDFTQLLDFLQEAQLDRVGAFPYSEVAEADATAFPDQVPEERKQERYARLMALQQGISRAKLAAKVGRETEVLIDALPEAGVAVGRSQADAPDIDGSVRVRLSQPARVGDRLRVRISGASDYDLEGVSLSALPWPLGAGQLV